MIFSLANGYSELWQFTCVETFRNSHAGTVTKHVTELNDKEAEDR